MLDFQTEERLLLEEVGATSGQVLGSGDLAQRFQRSRDRMSLLADEASPSQAVILERDRLASYFGCAYGRNGLLARAGSRLTLRAPRDRVSALAPRLVGDAPGRERLRREALIARTFARERLGRSRPQHPGDATLMQEAEAACRATSSCADLVGALKGLSAEGWLGPRGLWASSDLAWVASDFPRRPLLGALAFLLARLGDAKDARSNPAIEGLLQEHLQSLRTELWEAQEAELASAAEPASLSAIEQADRELAGLVATLSDGGISSAARAQALGFVRALCASARAKRASDLAREAFDAVLALLAEGLASDAKGGGR